MAAVTVTRVTIGRIWACPAPIRRRWPRGSRAAAPGRPRTRSRAGHAQGPGQVTHKVSFRNMGKVDAEIVRLLRVAYEQNA